MKESEMNKAYRNEKTGEIRWEAKPIQKSNDWKVLDMADMHDLELILKWTILKYSSDEMRQQLRERNYSALAMG